MLRELLGQIRLLVRSRVAWFCPVFVFSTCTQAGVDICQQADDNSYFSVGVYRGGDADLDGNLGSIEQDSYLSELLLRLNENWSLGVGHNYTIMRPGGFDLQTNGHLHTLYFPLHWKRPSGGRHFRATLAPAVSVSSNVLKEPDEYGSDAVQVLGALEWDRAVSETLGLRYGVCGDHRFGSYRVYPLLSVDWRPHVDWLLELGFPATALSYEASKSFDSSLRLAPNGNEWYVKDKSLEHHSKLRYESLLLEWALNWHPHERLTLTASIGRQFRNRYDMKLLDGSRAKADGDSFTRVGAALEWQF